MIRKKPIAFFVSLVFFSGTFAGQAGEKLKLELMNQLMTIGSQKLPKSNGCESFTFGGKKEITILDFFAWNLQYFSEGKANSITAVCNQSKMKSELQCELNFNADSRGESPWSCGLRINRERKSKTIRPDTLECIGSC